jgi:alkyldihydroxyacetonephosphate synthase
MTFAIAYVRDFGTDYCFIAESFETSVPWSKVSSLCEKVRASMINWTRSKGIEYDRVFLSFRVTQIYETGAAIYIYFGFNYGYYKMTKAQALAAMEEIEIECREEVMRQGGALSHHHGVGKMKKRFMKKAYPPQTNDFFNTIKKFYDP